MQPGVRVALGQHRRQLAGRLLRRICVIDAGVRLHELAQGPERDAFSVGQTPTLPPCDEVVEIVEVVPEIGDEPRLAHSGLTQDRDQLHRGVASTAGVDASQQAALGLPAEERRLARVEHVGAQAPPRTHRPPDRDGVALALGAKRLQWQVLEYALRCAIRRFAHGDGIDRSACLDSRGGIDHIAGHESLSAFRPSVEIDDHLSGVDTDADGERLCERGGERVDDRERGSHGALGVILVRERCAEHGHDGIADELLDGTAERLDAPPQQLVVVAETSLDVFGVGRLGGRGETDEIAEQDGNRLAFLPARPAGLDDLRAAGQTEPRDAGVFLAARGARDRHLRSVGSARSAMLSRLEPGLEAVAELDPAVENARPSCEPLQARPAVLRW